MTQAQAQVQEYIQIIILEFITSRGYLQKYINSALQLLIK